MHKQESRPKVPKSVLRAVLARMQLTLHANRRTPHGASRLVQAMPAWLVRTRRAPSRHSRDARVYGHTTTAMHKLSTSPPPPPSPPSLPFRVHAFIFIASRLQPFIPSSTRIEFVPFRDLALSYDRTRGNDENRDNMHLYLCSDLRLCFVPKISHISL